MEGCPNCCNDDMQERLSELRKLPFLNISSPASNVSHLTDSDIDFHMPNDNNFDYYTTHNFHSNKEINECSSNPKSFAALHCNIRSISANFDNFIHMLTELNFSFPIIGLSETKFVVDKDNLSNVNMVGYDLISNPSLSNAGGVAFYIRNDFQYILRSELTTSTPDFEALWIEINARGQQNLICGVVYRHPNSDLSKFKDYVDQTTETIDKQNKLCMIMGDFNIDLLKVNTHADSENFINSLGSSFLLPQILQPTRITDHSATLIDNIFFNGSIEHLSISGNIVYPLTDHLPNFLIFNKFSTLPSNINLFKRDYTNFNETALIEEVSAVNWQLVFNYNPDPTNMFDIFYKKISEIIDKHAPMKKISKRELKIKSKPWITPAIKKSISIKNNLYKKYLNTKSEYYHCKFKTYRNKINHLLKLSKRSYYNNYFLVNTNNPKKIWNGIKEIVHFKETSSHKVFKIKENNKEITDPKLIANAFNKYFTSVGSTLADKIPSVQKSPLDYLKFPVCDSFCIFPVTASEIETEISNLKLGKASGPYSIPVNILKILKNVISKPLEILFNISFSLGIVPECLKMANVIPVFKKDDHSSLCNYRPISLLSIFNKLLEKLMCSRLVSFLEKHNILYDKQFGFRNNHSTVDAILSIIDKIQTATDTKHLSCGIFLDFSKAFDTVNHDILIKKLEHYGIRGVAKSWFTSYLNNRQQTVTINNTTSDPMAITCGIPQGSVLGPLLFLLYINDFHLCSSLFDFHLFADDANLFYSHNDITLLQHNINSELTNVHSWLCSNKLSLNIDKSNFVIFHPPQKKLVSKVVLQMNGKKLKQEKCIKYLGIYIDSNLSWKPHVEYVSKKIRRSIGILSKIRYYVDINVLIQLYYALIYPFLIYGIIAWGNTYQTTLQPLYILQKKSLRLITFSRFDDHSSPLFKKLKILKLQDIVKLYTLTFMFKFHNQLLPSIFTSFFIPNNVIHNYETRLATNKSYYIQRARTNYGIFNIRFQGPKLWNSIEENLKTASLKQFKIKIQEKLTRDY